MQTGDTFALQFYDNSIFPGTKIMPYHLSSWPGFYDNSIFPGTKINELAANGLPRFYDNSIFPGTKIPNSNIH